MPATILSDNGASSGTAGLKTSGSNDGILELQTTTGGGTATTAITINTSQAATFAQTANLPNTFGFKNRIINGDMRIAQRGTAAVTTDSSYPVDRFFIRNQTDGAVSVVQSSTVPSGFVNSIAWTTTTADASLGSVQYAGIFHKIEGFNVADLGWGTASAKTITLSFWARSSLTGTFGGSLRNGANDRSYPFTYTISAANTYEYKTVTVAGDTSGTWLTNNGVGLDIVFGLGVGSTLSGTAGSWSGSNFLSATGATNVMGTLNATFYITGVQLEVGSTATSFDYRDYGRELAMCQRYYEKSYNISVVPGTVTETGVAYTIEASSSGNPSSSVFYNVRKRASATITVYSSVTGASGKVRNSGAGADENASVAPATPGENNFSALGTTTTSGTPFRFQWVSSSEL